MKEKEQTKGCNSIQKLEREREEPHTFPHIKIHTINFLPFLYCAFSLYVCVCNWMGREGEKVQYSDYIA